MTRSVESPSGVDQTQHDDGGDTLAAASRSGSKALPARRALSPDLSRTLAIGPVTIRFDSTDVATQLDQEIPKLAAAGILVRTDANACLRFTSDRPFTICGDAAILTALGLTAGTHPASGNFAADRDYELSVHALKTVLGALRNIPARTLTNFSAVAEIANDSEPTGCLSEEAANLVALEIRQQLSAVTQSLTNYAQNSVLELLK
ncbi:hypothetical protein [Devosia sp.]|uniref:hypothetical protein n=1 Tax=Devosia sp. TaxID=1871048 RepID=UPI003A8E8E6C